MTLKNSYNSGTIKKTVFKLFCLQYRPAGVMPDIFETIAWSVEPGIVLLCDYILRQWITSTMWHPGFLSRFNEFIRTNNDADGLLHCKNGRKKLNNMWELDNRNRANNLFTRGIVLHCRSSCCACYKTALTVLKISQTMMPLKERRPAIKLTILHRQN